MDKLKYFLLYFIIINLISFILFFIDKQKAKKDRWRIQEKTLHAMSFLGGVFGSIAAMIIFHHKTKKTVFVVFTIAAFVFNVFVYYKLYQLFFM
ncbi:MAG TPA: DUF1294 domain-containing protein [Clostridiales bacterium]|nr:DUF1294 domain-containing protein [Clostridiales bacterium]